MRRVYLDHNATTPVRQEVLEAMLPYFAERFGNASSVHGFGREARRALEDSREIVAKAINAEPSEVIFTGSGTEADNTAIKGIALALADKGRHIVTSRVEHKAVLETCKFLEKQGFRVTYVPVDRTGMVLPERVAEAIQDDTILVSVMHANNEVGTINPIARIGAICRERGVLFHTDAVQSFCKIPFDVREMNVDLASFSAHKIYGPKGVGALFVRRGIRFTPLLHGGEHERKRRAGTENVAGIVGFARAVQLALAEREAEADRLTRLRDRLWEGIRRRIERVHLNGHPTERLPGTLNVSFEGAEGESILLSLDLKGVAASSGSACTSGSLLPSHVLEAMGVPPELAQSAVRFSLGRSNTEEDVDYTVEVLPEIVARLRQMSALEV
ncbi:MAG: cysteine desulfurase NifS [candidate division KSB1 bacterium]|nr:cysteine desulfurase NifS [candidate division KSB1 bacterium]